MSIPQTFIQELLTRADVVDIVGRYVQLKKGGANFMGLCPFHGEKSPSFSVSPTKQFFHCFGCGKSGNAIGFLMDHAGMNFVEAVKDLAQQYGLAVPEEDSSPQDRVRAQEQRQKQVTLNDVLEKAGEAYRGQLKESPRAIEYFKGRGVSGEVARQFGLGYAPMGWRSLASVFAHYDDPLLVESGLVILTSEKGEEEKRYDRFRDRVMFPIRNVKGECIGFGGRVLGDEKPKYLNSPETPVFSKGRELYGLFEARQALREHGFALVTEGYMDVVALAQLGFPNAVATLGTACTHDHVQKLFRFTDSVIFSFDGDAAGRRAARKALDAALPFATDVRNVKFLFLPSEHDPDSFIREHGKDGFSRCISEAVPLSRFLIDATREGLDLSSAEGRAHMASNAKPLWMQMPDGALKRQLLTEIASHVKVDKRDLSDLWSTPEPSTKKPFNRHFAEGSSGSRAAGDWGRRTPTRSPTRPSVEAHARNIASILLDNCNLWDQLTALEHETLCALEGVYGELFRWVDHQMTEHGVQPLAALAVAMQGQSFEETARAIVEIDSLQPLGREVESAQASISDLRVTVIKLRLDIMDSELKRLQELPGTDPNRVVQEDHMIRAQLALKQQIYLKKPSEMV